MSKHVGAAVLAAACILGLPAAAQEAYLGASYLDTSFDFDAGFQDFDADSNGWKIFGGFQMSPNFAVEVGYYDLGDFDDQSVTGSFDAELQTYDFCGHGILPLGERFEIFVRLGYSYVDVEARTTSGIISVDVDATDWELSYGAGIGFKIGTSFGVRAEYEAWDTEDDLDAFSAGLVFRFGRR